jgi:hypothetical protein
MLVVPKKEKMGNNWQNDTDYKHSVSKVSYATFTANGDSSIN